MDKTHGELPAVSKKMIGFLLLVGSPPPCKSCGYEFEKETAKVVKTATGRIGLQCPHGHEVYTISGWE